MAETETDYEKRYNDQQRYVRELEAKAKQYEEDWQLLSTDPRYKPAYEHIQKVAKGDTVVEEKKPETPQGPPSWFTEWQEKEYKPLRSDFETRRQKAFREWEEKVVAREKALSEKFPELATGGWFGAGGKVDLWMKRTGEDDIEKAIRANLEPKYWYEPESDKSESESKKPKREPSERPVEGKPTKTVEEPALNAEQAINRARARFREDPRVAG